MSRSRSREIEVRVEERGSRLEKVRTSKVIA